MDAIMGAVETMPSLSGLSDTIGDALGSALNNTLGRVLYMAVSAVSWLFSLAYQLFEAFSGQIKVSYNGEYEYLTNIFFENSTVSGVYWGMAIIGVVLCFAFTIIAVIKKMFDGADKIQTSMGAILGSMFKSILLILSLNAAMVVVLNFSNVLMQRVVYVFNAGSALTESQRIDFTEDQFATMGRILNTIGNYSLNPSRNSRYNLNSCFNEVRGDLLELQDQGVFEFYYLTKNENGEEVETWQSAMQTLVFAGNLEEELKMDVYNESVANALLDIMEILESNTDFYPLKYYERVPLPRDNVPLDRVLFLACTYNAARNEQFNVNPSHTDPLRGPYYNGQKSIYDYDQVVKDFNLIWGFNYVVFGIIVYGIWKELLYILLDCVARLYNMVLLYLVGPPFIALSPLDNGAKTKQWMTAFVVQCFGVFGTVISMRLLMTFIPIVMSLDLRIFEDNPALDVLARMLLVDGGFLTAKKASAMFTGILADSAGWQSITAGSLRSDYDSRAREDEANADKKENRAKQYEQEKKQKQQELKQRQQEKQQQQQKQQNTTAPKPQGNTTPPPQGNTTPPPQGNTTPPPQKTTPPQGNTTPPPPQGNTTPTPPQGNTTTPPPQKTTPPQGNTTTPPPQGNTTGTAPKTGSGTGGFRGIPVAPDINKTNHYKPPKGNTPPQGNTTGTAPKTGNGGKQQVPPGGPPGTGNQNQGQQVQNDQVDQPVGGAPDADPGLGGEQNARQMFDDQNAQPRDDGGQNEQNEGVGAPDADPVPEHEENLQPLFGDQVGAQPEADGEQNDRNEGVGAPNVDPRPMNEENFQHLFGVQMGAQLQNDGVQNDQGVVGGGEAQPVMVGAQPNIGAQPNVVVNNAGGQQGVQGGQQGVQGGQQVQGGNDNGEPIKDAPPPRGQENNPEN